MNMLLTCIIYCDAGPGPFDQNCMQVQYVDSYHGYICPRTFFFGDALALLRESYTFV